MALSSVSVVCERMGELFAKHVPSLHHGSLADVCCAAGLGWLCGNPLNPVPTTGTSSPQHHFTCTIPEAASPAEWHAGKGKGFCWWTNQQSSGKEGTTGPPPTSSGRSAGLNRWDSASVLGDETRGLFFPPTPSRAVRRKTTASSYEGVVVCSQ